MALLFAGTRCVFAWSQTLSDNGWLHVSTVREARFYRNVGLWLDGVHRCNLVLATVKAKESWWPLIPTLQTLWQYAGNESEELFLIVSLEL